MAPPLRKGVALARQRGTGLLFLVVLFALIAGSVGAYQKAFTPVVHVTLHADRIGNQLTRGADVKARGLLVGEVRGVHSTGDGATLDLALDPDEASRLPASTRAQLLPKTLFGEKFVSLVFDDDSAGRPLRDGDVISGDRSATATETAQALDDLLPLLQTLRPEQVSVTLNALSTALRDRGDRIGANLVLARDYLAGINPDLATIADDFAGTADLADTLDAVTPDLSTTLDDSAFLSRSLEQTRSALDGFLRQTSGMSATAEDFLQQNEHRFVSLAADSLPSLQVYERYAPEYPCMLGGIARVNDEGERVFGGNQPGLHITLEVTKDDNGYRPGDEPVYGEDGGPTCFGLDGPPIVPFPITIEVTDGYCDDQEQQPGVQTECKGRDNGPVPGPPSSAGPTPFAPASYDRAAIGAVVAPVLGVPPEQVPDVAVLLFGPVARDTQARVA